MAKRSHCNQQWAHMRAHTRSMIIWSGSISGKYSNILCDVFIKYKEFWNGNFHYNFKNNKTEAFWIMYLLSTTFTSNQQFHFGQSLTVIWSFWTMHTTQNAHVHHMDMYYEIYWRRMQTTLHDWTFNICHITWLNI